MIDENGNEMSEKVIIKESLDLLSEVCCLLFETESPEAIAAAYMADSLIKYLQCIYRDDDVLLASTDYAKYENDVYLKSKKHLRVVE